MFEKIVQRVINRIMGEYIENFNSDNLKIGIWSGQVSIQNVRLKADAIKKLNLPFKIKYSRLGCLRMSIPWSSLGSSKIDVVVEGLQIIIYEVKEQLWQCKNNKIIQHRKKQIQQFCDSIIADFAKKSSNSGKQAQQKQQGYFASMAVKIIDNVQVVVRDIHVRFEDCINNKFSFGITLEELKVFTVNRNGKPQFIDRTKKGYENEPLRKKLQLSNFGVYWNESNEFFSNSNPHEQMVSSIAKKNQPNSNKMNYLLLMSSNAMLYLRDPGKQFQEPEINLRIQFNEVKLKITNSQLQQIVNLGERLQKYSNELKAQNRKKLTQLQILANKQVFMKIFPTFFEKKNSAKQLQQLQQILEKMQIQHFQEPIRIFLQSKQKQKMIQEKIQKNQGWFAKSKELSEEQVQQIERFLTKNFGKQIKSVKRPQDYYYIRLNFNLNSLEVSVGNDKINQIKEGIKLKLIDIKIQFNLRQTGHLINFAMNDISLELFQEDQDSHIQETLKIIEKRISIGNLQNKQYVKFQVIGNPPNKKYLNQEIIVRTEQLLIQFHPKIIKIAQEFMAIRLNSHNSEAALEAYGELKHKAEVAATQSFNKPFQKKNLISLDVKVNAISLILFFNPSKIQGDVWLVKLGELQLNSDQQLLKITEFSYDEPMEKYDIKFKDMSLIHRANKSLCFSSFEISDRDHVIKQLSLDFQIELFKDIYEKTPKIRIKSLIHKLNLNLSAFIYQSLQKIPECLEIQDFQENSQRQKIKMLTKAQIMKEAVKIGIVYEQTARESVKYIGVLTGLYLYLYKDKKDLQYSSYYSLRKCEITYNEQTSPLEKMLQVKFKNSINQFVLGFEKIQIMEEWIRAIMNASRSEDNMKLIEAEQNIVKRIQSTKELNHNKLNFQIIVSIEEILLNTSLQQQKSIVLCIKFMESRVRIYEHKNILDFSLLSIQIIDNLHVYKYKELNNLLYSTTIEGKQKLIEVNIINYAKVHPDYSNVDAIIYIEFGKLICNYKPETIERLMNFYLPKDTELASKKKQKGSALSIQQRIMLQKQRKQRKQKTVLTEIQRKLPQIFLFKLRLKIDQISASMINHNNKVMFATLGLSKFDFSLSLSSRRIVLGGELKEIWFADYSGYPYTIYEQQEHYRNAEYIIESYNSVKEMLKFDIELSEIPNEAGKSMFIDVHLRDLKVSYIQQPVLRVITYLLDQVLPSLTPPEDLSEPKIAPRNDVQPQAAPFAVRVSIQNVLAIAQPRCKPSQPENLQLDITNVTVTNSTFMRNYILDKKSKQESVLVENYTIKISGVKIVEKLGQKETKLTNDLDLQVSCDLIQNPQYYRNQYGKRFDAGMRIECQLTPFLMCINHNNYNFIMKCLFWNITFDDNAESYFFPSDRSQALRQSKIQASRVSRIIAELNPQPLSEPIHVTVEMSKILVCVTQKGFPLSVLLLNEMRYNLTLDEAGMDMIFKMKHLFGTTIAQTGDPRVALQRGMFNSFGYQKKHCTDLLYDMENFEKAFWPNVLMKQEKENILTFTMIKQSKTGNSTINLKIGELGIAIQLKTLHTLSQLALLESYTQPPVSQIKPAKFRAPFTQLNKASMSIKIEMSNFLGCLGDQKFQNYIVMEGIFQLRLKLCANLSEQVVFAQSALQQRNGTFRQSSSYQIQVKGYSIYFSNVHDIKNKRYLLLPLNCFVFYRTFYSKIRESVFLQSEIDGMIDRVIFQCSAKDILILNKIVQENLSSLANTNSNITHSQATHKMESQKMIGKRKNQQNKNEMSIINQSIQIDTRALERTIYKSDNKIRNKSKGTVKLQPIQVRIVNDCGHNFMPVLNFVVQQSCIRFVGDSVRQMLQLVLIVKLDFFNLRSACWQPIIESFQFSLQHIKRKVGNQEKTIIGMFSSQSQLKELKLNISTQLITTMYATFQIVQKQKRSLEEINQPKQKEVSQISPYIIENRSNYVITILRKVDGIRNDFDVKPFFKDQLRLDDGQLLQFRFKNKIFQTSVQKFGYVCVPGLIDIHLEFQIDKLNRVICFVDQLTIKNSTSIKIYCIRYNEKREKVEQSVVISPGQAIPFKKQWYAQFSFNMKTFTPPHKGSSLMMMSQVKAESQRFKLNLMMRQTIQQHEIICLKAPFSISNCLPKNIKVQFISNAKHVSTREIPAQTCHEVFANQQLRQFKFKILAQGFYWSEEFTLDPALVGKQQMLQLFDREKGSTTIKFLFQEDFKNVQFKLSIFCSAFILSELQDNIQIYGNLEKDQKNKKVQKYELLGGQTQFWKRGQGVQEQTRMLDKVILVGATTGSKLRICGCNCLIDFSEPFSINSIGVHQARVVVQRQVGGRKINVFTILGIDIQLKKMAMHSNIFSKQITIRYRHIISNTTEYQLLIKQEGSNRLFFSAQKGQKKPFFFSVPVRGSQQRKIIIKVPQTKQSLQIHSDALGSTFFRLELTSRRGEYLYFKTSTYQIDSYLFCQISSVKYENLPYQVEIKSDKFKIYVPAFEKVLTMNRYPLCFINQKTNDEHKLFILITLIETQQAEEAVIQVDNLNFKKLIRFTHKSTGQIIVGYIHVDFSDSKKLIVIEELKSDIQNVIETELQNFRLRLEKLSISLIQNHGSIEKPYESFYFYMQNLEMALLKTNLSTKFQVKLQFLQFDQSQPFNIPDPVIVTPCKYKQFTSTNPKDKPKSVFNLLVELDRKFVKNDFFKIIAVQINDIVVRTTTYFIKLAMRLIKEYNDVFKSENEFLIKKQIDTWRQVSIPSEQSNTYINSIQIGPFTVEISTQVRLNELDVESVVFFGTIINALGVVITNIENAPIVFEGIALDNCVDSIQGIQQKLIGHYKQSVMKQLYKVFGSLNIIGNPVGLFRNISTGIKAMKQKPVQGFVKGPLQFSKGLADGTSSLIAHSVGGALNSVEKITGTFASGLAVLSFDKQFEENREKQKMRKPKHVLEGLQKGGQAVFHGFKEGIAGVVTKPIQQTRKGGAVGLFKGVAKGLTGLVIKPVTGIVDFASKTTQGLKNTALYLQDKPNQSRIRNPRTFYTECGFIEEYNDIDSMLLAIVCKYEQKYCSKSPPIYMSAFAINQEQFLLVLKDDIMMINIGDEIIEWAIPLGMVSLSKQSDDQIRVRTDRNLNWTVKKINAVIDFTSKGQMNRFVKLIEELRINIKSNLMIESSFY